MTLCEALCSAHEQSANRSIHVPLSCPCGCLWTQLGEEGVQPLAGRASIPLLPVQLSSLAHQLSQNSCPWGRRGGYLILLLLFSVLGLLGSVEPSKEPEGSKGQCLS